jgi:hypothetical protein
MNPARSKWMGVLLLPLTMMTGAAEPTRTSVPTAAERVVGGPAATTSLAQAFDLRGANVQQVLRAAASTQANYDYRIETEKTPSADAVLEAALRTPYPTLKKKKPAAKPRVPSRPPSCDGPISCGVETLLGLGDFDEELYGRVERNRLMNQGSFTDRSKIDASIQMPMSQQEMQSAGRPLRP